MTTEVGAMGSPGPVTVYWRPGCPYCARRRRAGALLPAVQWVAVVALLVASATLDGSGHAAASWGLDAVAAVVYLAVRVLRHRMARGELG